MNKMKQQMEAELKQLEKDDPETAKMVKQMMVQTQTKPGNNADKNKSGNEFVQKIPLKAPVTPPTQAQAQDQLLWYKGKKIDAFTLITTSGTIAQYQSSNKRVVVQPDPKKDKFNKIISILKESEKLKEEFIEKADKSKNSYFIYPFVKEGLDGIDEAEKIVSGSLANVIELPPAASQQETPKKSGETNAPAAPSWVIAYHDEVMRFVNAHQNDALFSFPPPPEHAFDYCLQCDSLRRKKEDEADSMFQVEFSKDEAAICKKAFAVMQAWQQANQPKEWEQMSNDMIDANIFLFNYLSKKCDALLSKYQNNFRALPVIIETVLALERQKQLLGIDDKDDRLPMIAELLKKSDQYLDEQIKEKNFAEVLNYRWIVAMAREKQLLGMDDENSFGSLLEKLDSFNRFKLTIDAEVKVVTSRDDKGNIKDWVMAHLTGSEFFSMFPDSLCKMRLINRKRSSLTHNTEVTPEESYELTQFHLKLVDAKATNASFVDPYEWISMQPMFAASFCHSLDTMILYGFGPYNSFQTVLSMKPNTEKWNFPEGGVQESGMISEAVSKGFHGHDIEEQTPEPDSKAIMNALTSGFSENSTLNNMKLRSNVMQLETSAFTPQHTGGIYLKGSLKNKTKLVFESEVNGKENNPDADDVILAKLSVKLEHAPL